MAVTSTVSPDGKTLLVLTSGLASELLMKKGLSADQLRRQLESSPS
jgi:hypothetical protein